ncbi:hypothetical protein WJ96_04130 [Burkholderia ubonensis]|uniref:Uncharacterized protein n=1 Tax=Burkholderia ubonensis TaxID=101571 RepID=A0AAW3MWT2_9BURK|nr:hypothetical protein [Burkholderia ubonensis]KVP65562.1 hypothetical protein WJ93_23875 [Burkholderia ubonensis]KVP97763.1 hypothetical protein WJ96_04130 [Burkholderia ubonensis]KVZ92460.1 hypothetical protein WL25_15785 [Burkholderia ubonensis]
MSKSSSRTRRAARPLRVSPLIAQYVPALATGSPATLAPQTTRNLLVSKTWFGVTVNRYQNGYEIIFADGRKLSSGTPWGLLVQMFKGGAK